MAETHRNQVTPNLRYGSNVGQPLTRRDAILKVTGRASYAADNHPEGMLYAACAVSTIARGRVTHLDVEAAKAHPNVVEVMTPANRPPLAGDPEGKHGLFAFRLEALQNDRVRYANQPIALVVAKTLEAATEGAALLKPRYEVEPARVGLDVERFVPEAVGVGAPATIAHSDVETGLSAAPLRIDATYETPSQYHNAMEPHAIVASWDGDRLTLDTPNQAPHMARAAYAGFFGVPPENVLIRTPFIGGGFGSKAILAGAHILCVLAARMTGRPVKLALTRISHRGHRLLTLGR
jgi:xanthine dehydrogenase YagR molybdenum-binding subunit